METLNGEFVGWVDTILKRLFPHKVSFGHLHSVGFASGTVGTENPLLGALVIPPHSHSKTVKASSLCIICSYKGTPVKCKGFFWSVYIWTCPSYEHWMQQPPCTEWHPIPQPFPVSGDLNVSQVGVRPLLTPLTVDAISPSLWSDLQAQLSEIVDNDALKSLSQSTLSNARLR